MDATRGLALLGMMAVHVLPAVDPDGSASTAHSVAGGRSAATFAVLAGVGLALATGGTSPPRGAAWAGAAVGVTVRAIGIGAVGLALGTRDSGIAVILAYYAVLFVLAVPLLRLGPRVLGAAALAVAVAVPALSHILRRDLPRLTVGNPTLDSVSDDPLGWLRELLLTGYYPALAWTAYLCAGLAVGRLPLRSPSVAAGLVAAGAALAAGALALSQVLLTDLDGTEAIARAGGVSLGEAEQKLSGSQFGTTPPTTWWWLAVDAPHSSTPLDLLHTTGIALALLGAALLLAHLALAARWLLPPLAAAGTMTLSLYTAHILLLSSDLLPSDPHTSYAVQAAAALAAAVVWRLVFGRGPLEAAIALIAEPLRRAVPGAGSPRVRGTDTSAG